VGGALMLERAVRTVECSLVERVARAAAAGALGWVHGAQSYPASPARSSCRARRPTTSAAAATRAGWRA
jgi:hypothetical protein